MLAGVVDWFWITIFHVLYWESRVGDLAASKFLPAVPAKVRTAGSLGAKIGVKGVNRCLRGSVSNQ